MKTIVIYKSKTGFTEKYAQWISEALSADICEEKKFKISDFEKYDTIVYGGGVYADMVSGIKLITKNLNLLKSKKIIIYATGAFPDKEEIVNKVKNQNLTLEQQKQIIFYYCRGGVNYDKLSGVSKLILKSMSKILAKKKELTNNEKEMLEAISTSTDFTDKKYIKDLISCVKG